MSQKADSLEMARQLVYVFNNSEPQQLPKNIDKILSHIQSYETPETFKDSQERQIDLLNRRQHEIERRVSALEYESNMRNPIEIEALAKKIFAEMPAIKSVYARPTQSGFVLITIHNSETISNVIEQIQPGFAKLEDEFPDMYFEPRIIHSSDVQEEYLQQSKMIFKR